LGQPYLHHDYSQYRDIKMPNPNAAKATSPEEWLAKIIRDWQPDIIHTLGMFDRQGGAFYFDVRKQFSLQGFGKWILQVRGGSDLALRQHDPEVAGQILEMFKESDGIITDNYVNIAYIKKLGLGHKVASIAPVPGTGGLDIASDINNILLPSKKERVILWPKAYESVWSKALPVLEAIKISWQDIKPCKIYMTAAIPEVETWFLAMLPEEIRENCIIVRRIPRSELLDLMKKARVLLIPSLVDGVPNSLYEAMANGTFPIVSPLDTMTPIVKNESNVLFARNLYPNEISEALIRAMSDDLLIDAAAKNNLSLVKQIARREKIAAQVIKYYQDSCRETKL
jgi:glycosyltransferase involved in cell wall biosynthesis